MNLAALQRLQPTEYFQAASGYRSTADMASAAKDHVGTQIVAAMRHSLKGEAAEAAVGQLIELAENFHYVQLECGLASTTLEAFAHEMKAVKRKLNNALADAKAAGLTVNSDGSVT